MMKARLLAYCWSALVGFRDGALLMSPTAAPIRCATSSGLRADCSRGRPVKSLGPHMSAGSGVDELRGDADLIGDSPEAAFDDVLRI